MLLYKRPTTFVMDNIVSSDADVEAAKTPVQPFEDPPAEDR